jgi:Helicase associated domain
MRNDDFDNDINNHHHQNGRFDTIGGGTTTTTTTTPVWRPFDRQKESEEGNSSWHRRFQRLQTFYNKYGHSGVPVSWALDPDLGDWACQQRQFFREIRSGYRLASKVDETRWRQLESVHFPLNYEKFHWTKRYHELQEALDGERYVSSTDNTVNDTANDNFNGSVSDTNKMDSDQKQHDDNNVTTSITTTLDDDEKNKSFPSSHGVDPKITHEQPTTTTAAAAPATLVGTAIITTAKSDIANTYNKKSKTATTTTKLTPMLETWLKNEQEKPSKLWWYAYDDEYHPNNVDTKRVRKLTRLGVEFPHDDDHDVEGDEN